ncbi:hypothetical protein HWV07_01120 [Natronomonas salina]|uniref:hypothetical protein n=1 Tax=Natronomonas salina TaxID=1710540 RepID=UPI0015B50850|nr:hypothetical protein [Natronomonas salina]QLD87709.1 hypothetical protein HWV07_01120 [Natronomonas salina]
MNRRRFLGATAAVTTGLLGNSFASRNAGIGIGSGVARAASGDTVPSRATDVGGRVAAVDGATVTVDLVARDAAGPTRAAVVRREYPDGDVIADGHSEPVQLPEPGASATVDVEIPYGGYESGRWFYEVYTVDDAGSLAYLCESAPYRWRQRAEYGADRAERVTGGQEPIQGPKFGRRMAGNDYRLRYRWHDSADRDWDLQYRLRRSVHEAAVARERGYAKTFEESQTNPYARDLASAISSDAVVESDDTESETTAADLPAAEWFDLVVRFVQGLRYSRDVTTLGRYDYNRTVEETLVAGVGDCKDKTHLLAGLLGAPPLSCETAMLFQPAHVLIGVASADVPDRYDDRERLDLGGREFVPVDGSIRFDVGDYPDAPVTAAYGDDGWIHYDVGAIGSGLDRNLNDWFEQNVAN